MLSLRFDPFPVLETKRLVLHALTKENSADIFLLRGNPEAMKYIGKPTLQTLLEVEQLIAAYQENVRDKIGITWGITLKGENRRLVGTIGFHKIDRPNYRAEIGYILHPDQWGKGIMNEAIKSVLDYGFKEMDLHSIEARIDPKNQRSAQILLKNGFEKEAYFKEAFYWKGAFIDTEVYSLIAAVKR